MILLASALSSIRTVCPNRLSRRRWIIAVGLGCFLSLRTPSLIPDKFGASSCRRHHWSSASILRASVFEMAQQYEPYRNTGKVHVLYSFSFVRGGES